MSAHFSFEVVNALDYDDLRPDYAPDAVAWVAERGGLAPGSVVVDLAAGTGQVSRRFMPLGVDVVAVEPAANMRAVLSERLPTVRVLDGRAESIPIDTGSVDAVVVGNAFHHSIARGRSRRSPESSGPAGYSRCSGRGRSRRSLCAIRDFGRSTRSSSPRASRARSPRRTARGRSRPRQRRGTIRSSAGSSP